MMLARKIPFAEISTGKLRRYFAWENFSDILRMFRGIFEARKILHKFQPDVIIGTGGYVTLPVGLATWHKKIPFILFNADATPGLANKILSRFATKICLNFPLTKEYFPKNKTVITGMPVRLAILSGQKSRGLKFLKFSDKLPIVLIMGGSQGATRLNEIVREALPELLKKCQVVHLVGKGKMSELRTIDLKGLLGPLRSEVMSWVASSQKTRSQIARYRQIEFLDQEFPDVLVASDLVVCRSGASALAELAAVGIPSILIPLPTSANNHQVENARVFANAGATKILFEKETSSEQLTTEIITLLDNKTSRQKMSVAVKKFFNPESAQKILRVIQDLI